MTTLWFRSLFSITFRLLRFPSEVSDIVPHFLLLVKSLCETTNRPLLQPVGAGSKRSTLTHRFPPLALSRQSPDCAIYYSTTRRSCQDLTSVLTSYYRRRIILTFSSLSNRLVGSTPLPRHLTVPHGAGALYSLRSLCQIPSDYRCPVPFRS